MTQRYDFLLTAVDIFESSYFEDKVLVWFFQTMKSYFEKYKEMPCVDPVLINEMKKAARNGIIRSNDFQAYADVCNQLKVRVNAQDYVIEEVIRFCRRQAGRKVYLDTASLMDNADDKTWDDIIDRLTKVTQIGSSYINMGTDYFATVQERLRARMQGNGKIVIPVGITELDELIGGGLRGGQLGLWFGSTGSGKSISICHCGSSAVLRGYKVAHYTLELDEMDISDRYDALWSQIPIRSLKEEHVKFLKTMQEWDQQISMRGGRLMIKYYPSGSASITTIKNHLKQLEASGWMPDLVLIDYMDLMKPHTNYKESHEDLGAIALALRGMAGERAIPVWSATQATRFADQSDVADTDQVGGSIKKAQITDILLALCATKEELALNEMRIYGAKNRNGPPKFTIKINTAYDRMTLHDILKQAPIMLANTAMPATTQAPPSMPAKIPGAYNRRKMKI